LPINKKNFENTFIVLTL